MRKFRFVLFAILIPLLGNSQSNQHFKSTKYFKYFDGQTIFEAPDQINDLRAFDLYDGNTLKKVYAHQSANDLEHIKYHQFYRGLKVLHGTVIYHTNKERLQSTSGTLKNIGGISMEPTFPIEMAESIAQQKVIDQIQDDQLKFNPNSKIHNTDVSFVISDENFPDESGAFTLAYQLKMVSHDAALPIEYDVLINAHSGAVISIINQTRTENVVGHGNGYVHKDIEFNVDSIASDQFVLRDSTRGNGVFAFDLLNNRAPFTDEDNEWIYENDLQGSALDGYYASIKFYDFLQEKFNRNSIDDEGMPLIINVNRHSYVNAFWSRNEATFGSGDCHRYNPLTGFEIVGHEYAHGLTQFTSDLIYQNESGALNESISDIFGKAFEFYYDNEHFTWLIGGTLPRNNDIQPFRSMEDPNLRADPKYYLGEFWYRGARDGGGVHTNSGVLNHWFYLLVEGGTGINEADVNFQINGIGMEDALQIVYQMQTSYLTESSGYYAAYQFSIAATIDLHGEGSTQLASVKEAWKAVGINEENGGGNIIRLRTRYNNTNNPNELYCRDDFQNLELAFTNLSGEEWPTGTVINGTFTISYPNDGTTVMETFVMSEIVLNQPLSAFDEFSSNISHDLLGNPTAVTLESNVNIQLPGSDTASLNFDYSSTGELQINDLDEPEIGFHFGSTENQCNESGRPSFDYTRVYLPRCNIPENSRLEIIFKGSLSTEKYTEDLNGITSSLVNIIDPIDNINMNALGPLNRVTYRIEYHTPTTIDTIYEENYASLYGNKIIEPTILEFNDLSDLQTITYEACQFCDFSIANSEIEILDFFNPNQVENCLTVEEYIKNFIVHGSTSFSEIGVCVDLINIADPVFAFDIKQLDHPDFSFEDNQYIHTAIVYTEDEVIISEPITSTNDEFQSIEIPLNDPLIEQVKIGIISLGTSTFIDNVEIRSGLQTSTHNDLKKDLDITYTNPVAQTLAVQINESINAQMQLNIFTSGGIIVLQQEINTPTFNIDMSSIPSGVYLLNIRDGQKTNWTKKVIKIE